MTSSAVLSFCVLLLSAAVGTPQSSSNSSNNRVTSPSPIASPIAPDPEELAGRIRALVRALQDADQLLRVLQDYRQRRPAAGGAGGAGVGDPNPTLLKSMKDEANHTMIQRLKSVLAKTSADRGASASGRSTPSPTPKKSVPNRNLVSNSTSRSTGNPNYKVIVRDLTSPNSTNSTGTINCKTKTCPRLRNKSPRTMLEPGARTKPRKSVTKDRQLASTTTKKVSAVLRTTAAARSDNGIATPLITNIYPMFGPGSKSERGPVDFTPKNTGGRIYPPAKYLLPPYPPMILQPDQGHVFVGETPWIPVVSPFTKDTGTGRGNADRDLYEVAAYLSVAGNGDRPTGRKKLKSLAFDPKQWKYTDVSEIEASPRDIRDREGGGGGSQRGQDQQLQLLHHIQQIKRMRPQDLPKTVAEVMYFNQLGTEYGNNDDLLSGSIPGVPGRDYPALSAAPLPPMQCRNRRGYFGDPRSRCQAFYICQGDGRGEPMLCPNGTIFSQDVLVCDWWFNVKCPGDSNHHNS